jgi:hypothetical protein
MSSEPANPYSVPPIYVVTMLVLNERLGTARSRRTWGWHPTQDLAEDSVRVNDGDLWENDYSHAVIEEFGAGSSARCTRRWWYTSRRADDGTFMGALLVDEPKPLHGIVNFGMG